MSTVEVRPTLREFMGDVKSRTGDPLEACALAEMAGYTIEDAQAEGWRDIFAATQVFPVHLELDPPAPHAKRGDLSRSFLRGLTYTAPVVAMWAILPHPMSTTETIYLGLAVVLSWGGSMASNHVVGEWMWGDQSVAWRMALRIATATVLVAVLVGALLLRDGRIGEQAAAVGGIQVLYFFCASPLMLRTRNTALAVISLIGAVAGGMIMLESTALVSGISQPWFPVVLPVVAASCLVAPSALLARQTLIAVRTAEPGHPAFPVRRDTVAFGAYGIMFGCLILWGPIVAPRSPVTILSVVVICGIAFAEVAVTRIRQRDDKLLDEQYEPKAFTRRARRMVVTGAALYLVPVALATAALARVLSGFTTPAPSVMAAAVAVVFLGAVQVLSLIGMSLHGIRQVAGAITTCALGLLVLTPVVRDSPLGLVVLYLIVMSVLVTGLLILVLRLAGHPINHI